jgi:hypothetical protein
MAERCESYHAIDLAWLSRRKMLQPGRSSSIQWSWGGQPAGSIGIVAKANCVHLVYRHRAWGDQWQEMREIISFTYTQTRFGGRRRWFECPRCGRACRVLFGGGPYRCRRCHGLHYSSQYQSAGSRTIGRLQALRTRLGGSGDLLEPFPVRPKHMQRRTYMRLRALDAELWRRTTLGLASDLESLRRRVGGRA